MRYLFLLGVLLNAFFWGATAQGAPHPQAPLPFGMELPQKIELGQPFVVTVTSKQQMQAVTFTWLERSLKAVVRPAKAQGTEAAALLGTDVLRPPEGKVRLGVAVTIDGRIHHAYRNVVVAGRDYPEQRLKVSKKYVAPPKKTLDRIAKESKLVGKTLRSTIPAKFWTLPLVTPVKGRTSSIYGLRRFFNDQPRRPHRGLDIAAPTGTPVQSAADGVVLLSADHYFAGKSVYVDHGQGVITAYFHLNESSVKADQVVKAGQAIGTVGATGRVTGAHLHFGVYVLGQAVDPVPLLTPPTGSWPVE